MAGFKDSKPMQSNKTPRLADIVEVQTFPSGKWMQARLIGPVWSYTNFWFDIMTKGDNPRKVSIPKLCLDYNPKTEEFDSETCPYRKSGAGRASKFYVVNAIIRNLQENEPAKRGEPTKSEAKLSDMCGYEAHVKAGKDTKLWTPVRVLQIPASLAEQLRNLAELNKVKSKKTGQTKTYDLAHDKFGVDLNFFYDKEAKGTAAYKVQKEQRTPLTDEEKEYAIWKLDVLQPEDLRRATQEMETLSKKLVGKEEEEEDDGYERGGRSSGKKSGKKRRDEDEDDVEEDSIDDVDDDEDDEDEKPRGKKDKKSGKKRRDEDEDEDEDEKPRRRRSRDDDDDDDDDD